MPEHNGNQLALMTASDICKLLRVGRTWVYDNAKRGTFPRPAVQARRFSRWRESDVQQWLAAHNAQEQ